MKKIISFLLAFMLMFSLCLPASALEIGIEEMQINPYGKGADSIDTVTWYKQSDRYFLLLPENVNLQQAKVYFSAMFSVDIDDKSISSGDSAAYFTPGDHTLTCGVKKYPLTVCFSQNIPAVFITTESGSLSHIHENKENKESGMIRVYENGQMTLDSELKQIKGRGNATWFCPKKPYNIKFDSKTALLGMAKAKKWTLLANYADKSLIHNAFAWEFSDEFGLMYGSEYRYVDLYINGEYLGNYVICESVEVGSNRVDIEDLEDANEDANPDIDIEALPRGGTGANGAVQPYTSKGSRKWVEIPQNPENISGGYLLEYEYGKRYDNEVSGFVLPNGQSVVLKSPEYASKAQVNYIADFVGAATDALFSETGYNDQGKHYSEYIDMDSLINTYILQEISMNFDAGFSSFFAYKDKDSDKIVYSPVWDMDNAFGCNQKNMNVSLSDYSLWWVNQMIGGGNGTPTVMHAAYRHPEFRAAVRERWAELKENGAFDNVNTTVKNLVNDLQASSVMNGIRWNHFSTQDRNVILEKWLAEAGSSMSFVQNRTKTLDKGFGEKGAYVYYDVSGAKINWCAFVTPVLEIGDTATIRAFTGNSSIRPPSGMAFKCWNTAADGSGVNYYPGDTVVLTQEATTFYAVWEKAPEPAPKPEPEPEKPQELNFWQKIVNFFKKIIDFFKDMFGIQ
ncbi:MAG: CotH kinase family protein [Clostridia bacterium]|nr:CotH kinase family protein [Clostridia bacterium]